VLTLTIKANISGTYQNQERRICRNNIFSVGFLDKHIKKGDVELKLNSYSLYFYSKSWGNYLNDSEWEKEKKWKQNNH